LKPREERSGQVAQLLLTLVSKKLKTEVADKRQTRKKGFILFIFQIYFVLELIYELIKHAYKYNKTKYFYNDTQYNNKGIQYFFCFLPSYINIILISLFYYNKTNVNVAHSHKIFISLYKNKNIIKYLKKKKESIFSSPQNAVFSPSDRDVPMLMMCSCLLL
jgi:hypothetical protein